MEVNVRLRAVLERFLEAMEDGIWHGVTLVLVVVHF